MKKFRLLNAERAKLWTTTIFGSVMFTFSSFVTYKLGESFLNNKYPNEALTLLYSTILSGLGTASIGATFAGAASRYRNNIERMKNSLIDQYNDQEEEERER